MRIVTKAPGRAVATEGRCVRAGRNESQRRLSSAVSPVYSTRTNMHFDTTGTQRSFVHSTTMSSLYRVPAAFAPRDSEPARRGARRLSHIEMSGHETLTRKKNKNKNATQYIHRLIYYHRQRKGRFPGQMPKHYLPNRQWISILPGTSCPSVETNRADEASRIPILS